MLVLTLWPPLISSLVVSAVLTWLNRRGVGALRAAAAMVCASVAIAVVQLAVGRVLPSRQDFMLWLLFVLTPAAAVFGLSRSKVLRRRPWWLLLAGPVVFVAALS